MKKALPKIAFIVFLVLTAAAFTGFIVLRMQKKHAVEADLEALGAELESAGLTEYMTGGSALELKRRYGLYAEEYPALLYFAPETYMNVEEILVVRISSDRQGDAVEEAVDAERASLMDAFESYGIDQYSHLKNAVRYRNEFYVCYAAGEKAEEILAAIRRAIER